MEGIILDAHGSGRFKIMRAGLCFVSGIATFQRWDPSLEEWKNDPSRAGAPNFERKRNDVLKILLSRNSPLFFVDRLPAFVLRYDPLLSVNDVGLADFKLA